MYEGSSFSLVMLFFLYSVFSYNSHAINVSQCGILFGCSFPLMNKVLKYYSLHKHNRHSYIFFGKMVIQIFRPFLKFLF